MQGLKFLDLLFEDLKIGLKLVACFRTWSLFALSYGGFGVDFDSFGLDETVFAVIFIEFHEVVNLREWLDLKVLGFESSGGRGVLGEVWIGGVGMKGILIPR